MGGWGQRENAGGRRGPNLPVARVAVCMLVDVYLDAFAATDGLGLGLAVAVLLVDVDLLAVLVLLGAALAVFENSDVLGVGLTTLSRSFSRLVDVD